MGKLYFIFLLVALTSADNPSNQHSSSVTTDASRLAVSRSSDGRLAGTQGYGGSSAVQSRTSSLNGENKHTSYISQSGAVRSGSDGTNSYTHQKAYAGTTNLQGRTGSEQDHNGLSDDEVLKLVAEGNRRGYQSLYNTPRNRPRLFAPQRYSPSRYYAKHPLFGRSGEEADAKSSLEAGSNSANANNREGSEHATSKSDSSVTGQESESSRRFYFPDDYNINPFNPYIPNNNPFDPYADLNNQNYLDAFGQFGNYLN